MCSELTEKIRVGRGCCSHAVYRFSVIPASCVKLRYKRG